MAFPAEHSRRPPRRPRPPLGIYGRSGFALASGWVAGFVDALGYMELVEVYTSHMTGNTAALGQFLTRHAWHDAWEHGWPILAFVAGLLLGAILTEAGRRRHVHSRTSIVLALEIVALAPVAGFASSDRPGSLAWLGLLALAMGMQTVTIMRIGELRVYSTYVTGSLAKFAEALAGYLFWLWDRSRERRRAVAEHQVQPPPNESNMRAWLEELRHTLLGHTLLTFGLWAAFLGGGLSGGYADLRWGLRSLWWPIAALGVLVILDLRRPVAAVTENEPIGFAH